jgi:dihydroneopterin aldolase
MCRIGIYDHERATPQRVLIDAELLLSPVSEPMSDDVDDSLNYDVIRETIVKIVASRHFDLQETLARELFDALRMLDGVIALRVRTAKPDAYPDCKHIAYQLSDL